MLRFIRPGLSFFLTVSIISSRVNQLTQPQLARWVREFHIFEIRYKDFGDPTTTMLLKAISVGLQYRFMFLEGKISEFSPDNFNATMQEDLRGKIAEMIQQLDYLLWYSRDAELRKPENILRMLGDVQLG
jgi:hypothetical protein